MERYTLNYYQSLFSSEGAEFAELVEALAQELEDYAREVSEAAPGWGQGDLARARHSHRPMVVNLGLETLAALETRLTAAKPEALGPAVEAFVAEARSLARQLRTELSSRST